MANELPYFDQRLEAFRPDHLDFSDLSGLVNSHYKVAVDIEKYIGPYNARQRNSQFPYAAPTREDINNSIKSGGMNSATFSLYVTNLIKFCEQTKGMRGLPQPHPSTIHSIQAPESTFSLTPKSNGITMIELMGATSPIFVKGLRNVSAYRFLIVKQRIGKLGTASIKKWDVLFFKQPIGYIPHWVDTTLNTKFSGIF